MRSRAALLISLFACGCSSSLQSFDANGNPLMGVPVRTPLLAAVTRVSVYTVLPSASANASYCKPDTAITLETLPIGQLTYINVKPATFGKSEFRLELSDAGMLKLVSLNSDPQTAQIAKELATAAGTLLPYLAAPKEAGTKGLVGGDESQPSARDKNCMRSSVTIVGFREVSASK